MEWKVKNLGISTGGIRIVVLNDRDAHNAGYAQGDRVLIKVGRREGVAIVDIDSFGESVKEGQVGLFAEIRKYLDSKNGDKATLEIVTKPRSVFYIGKKLRGKRLSEVEIHEIVKDVVDLKLTDVEMTYFVSACYTHELSHKETVALTRAIVETGEVLDFGDEIVADKHCIGGVAGNRTTCIVIPIVAAAGYTIPKTSSRSITSPAGTADTMEVLCNVTMTIEQMQKVIRKTNACMIWGGSMDVAPSDDTLIKVEHPLSLDPVGQMLASVLAKKKAAGSTHCLIDIPVGRGAKIESKFTAWMLKRKFERVGRDIGMKVKVAITDGSEPIGNGIGPALEARDLIWTLKGDARGSSVLMDKAIKLGGKLLEMLGEKNGIKRARELVESGEVERKFFEIVEEQGSIVVDAEKIKIGPHSYDFVASDSGKIKYISNKVISRIARIAGAPADKSAGIYLHYHVKDHIEQGDVVYTIYAKSKSKLEAAISYAKENKGFGL